MQTDEHELAEETDVRNVIVTLTYVLTDGSTASVDVDAVNVQEHLQGLQKAAKSGAFFGITKTVLNPAYIVRVDIEAHEEEK